MPITLNTPAKTTISNITYNNIMQDVYNLIQDNKALRDNWTDYISSDAGRMLTEVFAWVAERLAERIDVVGNELFLETAENKESVLRLLKLVGYKLDFPSSAYTTCLVQVINGVNAVERQLTLSTGISVNNTISLTNNSFKKLVHSSTSKRFEFIKFDEKLMMYDYFTPITTSTSSPQYHTIQEGETKTHSFVVNNLGYSTILLSGPVIKNSVEIYKSSKLSSESWESKRLKKVDNFFSREAQTSSIPIYKVNNLGNGECEIVFPSLDIVGKNHIKLEEEYTVIYRIGGGEDGNIAPGSLILSEQVYLNGGLNRFLVTFSNTTNGLGGKNELAVDEIKKTAPQDVRNYSAAITEEDYEYILKKNNSTIKDIKAYGEYNITSEEIEKAYQYYKNPLDVWLFIIKEKSGFSNDISNITDYINDITFETFDLNERLNEIYQINEADINIEVSSISPRANSYEFTSGVTTTTIYNPIILNVPEKIINKLEDATIEDGYQVLLTEYPYEEKKSNIIPNESNKKYIVNDSELINGYPKRYVNTTKEILEEEIQASLSSTYIGTYFTSSSTDSMSIKFGNMDTIDISFEDGSMGVEEFADKVNNSIQLEYYNTKQAVILKDNINDINGDASIVYSQGVPLKFIIRQSEEVFESFSITIDTATITWNALKDIINTALSEAVNLSEYSSDLSEKWSGGALECHTLTIYNTQESVSMDSFYVYDDVPNGLIEALDMIAPIESTAVLQINETESTTSIPEMFDFFVYEGTVPNGSFVLNSPIAGETIELGNTLIAKRIFGLTEDFFYNNVTNISGKKYFVIDSVSGVYKMIIGMPSAKEKLPNFVYISGFWGENNSIELGSYYSKLIEEDESLPKAIIDLLKRPPIRYLYNTVFNESERGIVDLTSVDIYNSEYELKFTREKISGYTFDQIGNIEEPPKVTFKYSSSSTFSFLLSSEFIRLRVNSEDLTGIEAGHSWTLLDVPNAALYTEDGFVRINLGALANKEIGEVLNSIKTDIFEDKISSSTTTGDIPYLFTTSNTYSSSLDFTGTSENTFRKIFSEDFKEVFYSTGAIIDAEQIYFKKIPFFRDFHLAEKSVTIDLIFDGASLTETMNTGFSMEQFKTSVTGSSNLLNKIIFHNDEMIFLSKKNGDKIDFSINASIEDQEKLFKFCPDLEGVTPILDEYSISKENSGDYYIDLDEENNYVAIVENPSAFPYGDIYIHMIEDYRGDHKISTSTTSDVTYTDEYVWENSLQGKKMLCVNHVYKQPRFLPFSADITVRILANAGNNKENEYKVNTENLLRSIYNVYDSPVGTNIDKNSLSLFIERNLNNVSSVSINYLGFDLEERTNNLDIINIEFNEKGIIASNKTKTVLVSGELTRTVIIQGLNIKVEQAV